jgi:hypothetical protein
MVISQDGFGSQVIYPHAEGTPNINTAHDRITVTEDGKVLLNGLEWTPEEAARYTANLKKAFDAAFKMVGAK